MKRRLLSAFLAVMMVLTMAPVAFAADEGGTTGVAKIGDVEYSTLQDAVDAAKSGDTIVLKKSISATEIGEKKQLQFVKADMNVTLDLNQNTITAEAGEAIAIHAANITLTVKNGTINNFAEGSYSDGVYAYEESNNLTLTFENIVLESRTQGLAVQGLTSNSNVNIVNSNIKSTDELGIYYPPKSGTLTISDSEIAGVTGIVVKGSNLVVNGEKTIISGTGPNVDPETYYTGATDGSSTLTETGDAVYVESGYNDRDISVSISGGHLNSKNAKAVRMFVKNGENTSAKREISVTGGTFSSDVSAYVAEGYVQNENGTVEQLGETNAVAKVGDTYYKTLVDAVAAANDGDTVTLLKDVQLGNIFEIHKNLTLDLGGKTLSRQGSVLDLYGDVIIKNGTITTTGTGTGAVWMNQTAKLIVEDDVTMTAPADSFAIGYYQDCTAAEVTFKGKITGGNGITMNGLITNTGTHNKLLVDGANITVDGHGIYQAGYSETAFSINDSVISGTTGIEVRAGKIEVKNSVVSGKGAFVCKANTNGTTTDGAGIAIAQHTTKLPIEVTISDGEISGPYAIYESNPQQNDADSIAKVKLSVTGGKFNGRVYSEDIKGFISGGYFTTDPSAYVASDYVAGTSDVSGYSYKVVAKTNTGNVEVKPAVAEPEVKVDKIPQKDQETVKAAAETVSAPTLGAATVDEAQKISEDKANELLKDVNVGDGVKKLYVQSSLKVEPTAYNETTKTLTLDITPQYRIVASTAATAADIELGDNGKNAEVVQGYQPLEITKPIEVTMELPTDFVADGVNELSVKHEKTNGSVEYYTGTVAKNGQATILTFTTNGFSPFTIYANVAAYIDGTAYPTLQAAVENVKNNETIKLAKDVDEATVVTVAKSINFTVNTDGKTFKVAKNIVAGSNTTVKVTGESSPYTYEFTYTKPSSSSSSGGSSSGNTTYKVTTSAVNNGGVNVSPSNAEKGAAITITLSPDKGYKLDKLTVTDGSGKTVSTVKKSDTVYTFTMPASAVNVGVSYVKATETPSETKFNDVSANDWFASAVDYVTGKGMMNGTADNTFSPKANTTRGMVVTVLYRLENQPSTSAASFTDVASGAYYANAVAWANANGIVSGYGSGKFGPNDKVTREQFAAILYRYAQYKKYDVSGANSLDGYADAQTVSSYAVPALQWANAAGVVTGKSGSKLDPKGNATRAEVAAMLMRFCENVK